MNIALILLSISKKNLKLLYSMYSVKTASDLAMKIRYEYYVLDKDRLGLYK